MSFVSRLVVFLCVGFLHAEAEWTFFVHIQANNDLSPYSVKDIKEMASIGSSEHLNLMVQIEHTKKEGLWRYKIEKDKVILEEHVSADICGDCVDDLVSGAKWAFQKYPSKYTAIALWNHGCGVLDPSSWKSDLLLRRFSSGEMLKSMFTRGILFNYTSGTFMSNQQLLSSLSKVKDLIGRKVDIIGMDACLMAMLEVAYQVKDYARYFVASEQVELADGWAYSSFLKLLKSGGLSPLECSRAIVNTYDEHYKKRLGWYTQSAVDLEKVDLIGTLLDQVVLDLELCKEAHGDEMVKQVVRSARQDSLQFETPCYIDLHSFCFELNKRIDADLRLEPNIKSMFTKRSMQSHSEEVVKLKKTLEALMNLIDNVVVANAAGRDADRAKGISIYFPKYGIDPSYPKTEFAKGHNWLNFIFSIL